MRFKFHAFVTLYSRDLDYEHIVCVWIEFINIERNHINILISYSRSGFEYILSIRLGLILILRTKWVLNSPEIFRFYQRSLKYNIYWYTLLLKCSSLFYLIFTSWITLKLILVLWTSSSHGTVVMPYQCRWMIEIANTSRCFLSFISARPSLK